MNSIHDFDAPQTHKRKKWPLIIGGLVVVGLLGWTGVSLFFKIKFGDFQPPFSPPAIVVAIVETKTIQDQIEAVGTTEANNSASITSSVTERVTSLPVEDGAVVSKGNVIAILSDTAERANVAEAQQAYNRYQKLADMNIASRARQEQELSRLEMANADLDDRVIRAPFDGVLGIINVDVGDMLTPGTMITTLDDIDPVDIEFTVPESEIAGIAIEMPITATSEAFKNDLFEGKITAIDSRIDPMTRALRVKASIPNTDGRLKPGLLMRTKIIKAVRPAMILPEGAILSKGDQKSVLVVGKDDIALEKNITVGTRQSGFVEITSGLSNGDKVIIEGQIKAQPNTKVKIVSTRTIDEITKDALSFAVDRKREAIETEMKVQSTVGTTTPTTETEPTIDEAPVSTPAPVEPSQDVDVKEKNDTTIDTDEPITSPETSPLRIQKDEAAPAP
jgi:membrane fusion protein (multidrug efflux system)